MDTLLVTGIDTVVGANLALALSDRFRVFGIGRHADYALAGCELLSGEAANGAAAAITQCRPDWVIHCGQISAPSWQTLPEAKYSETEIAEALELARTAERLDVPLTIVSTDSVFTGPRLFHEENARATAEGPVARMARRIEEGLADRHALVVRTHAYGWSPLAYEPGLVEQLVESLTTREPAPIDGLRYATPILASDLAELLLRAREVDLRGLYHITGAERTHPFRFATELANVLDLPAPIAQPTPLALAVGGAPVVETSLNSRRARRDLGLAMPLLREGLERLAAQAVNGFRDRLLAGAGETARHVRAA